MTSTSGTLNVKDFLKGALMAVGVPVAYLLQQLIPSWTPFLTAHFGTTGGVIAQAAISAFITYIIKNFFTNDVTAAQNALVATAEKQGLGTTITVTPTSVTAKNA